MSSIGEARSSKKAAKELREQADYTTNEEEKEFLQRLADKYDKDFEFEWYLAGQEVE